MGLPTLDLVAPTDRDDDAPDAPGEIESVGSTVPAVPDDDERSLPPGPTGAYLPATGRESVQPELEAGSSSPGDNNGPADASLELPRFVQPENAIGSGNNSGDHAVPARSSDDAASGSATRRPSKAGRGSRTTKADEEWAPKPLVSGDPLLTGSTPIVRRTDPQSPAQEPEPTARVAPVRPEPAPQSAPLPPEPQSPQPRPSGPPPPPTRRPTAPPGSVGGIGGFAGVPDVPNDVSGRTARRAARGAQITGQQPTSTMTRPVDPSGPVPTLRPTTVAPVPRLAGRRPRVRRVTRVVRHVDPWSVFKVAAVFSLVAYTIALVAGVLLWNVAYSTGTVDNIERGMESTGWSVFELQGGEIFHNAWIGGLFVAVGMTGLAVLVATLFNLITDLVGGIRFTVLEEEVIEKTSSPMRRFTTRRDDGRPAP